ncbi:MAG: hypothetical protein V8R97_11265 [Fusicatenibacter saccharivorans]
MKNLKAKAVCVMLSASMAAMGLTWLRFRQCGRNKNGNYCK